MTIEIAQWISTFFWTCRGPGFDSSTFWLTSITPGDLTHYSDLCGHQVRMWCTDLYADKTPMYISKVLIPFK